MVSRCPFAWIESKALSLPDLKDAISRHHPASHPVSPFIILVIFFEETGFCNISQAGTSGNLGCGFGQMEMSNPEKKVFYEWMGLPGAYKQVAAMMLADKDIAVKGHCKYFQYLTSVMGKDLGGCLGAQVGSHTSYIAHFRKGADLLEAACNGANRKDCIYALNYARYQSAKANGIPETLFKDYWEFILPTPYVADLAKFGY